MIKNNFIQCPKCKTNVEWKYIAWDLKPDTPNILVLFGHYNCKCGWVSDLIERFFKLTEEKKGFSLSI